MLLSKEIAVELNHTGCRLKQFIAAKLRKAQEDYKNHKHNAEEFRRMMEEELRLAEDANRILRGEC